jgi:hypothetical protein
MNKVVNGNNQFLSAIHPGVYSTFVAPRPPHAGVDILIYT